jgi:hypothetical protein
MTNLHNKRLKVGRKKFCGERKWCYLSMLLKHPLKEGVIIVASLKFKEVPNPRVWLLEEQLYMFGVKFKDKIAHGLFLSLFISLVNPKY